MSPLTVTGGLHANHSKIEWIISLIWQRSMRRIPEELKGQEGSGARLSRSTTLGNKSTSSVSCPITFPLEKNIIPVRILLRIKII